MTHPTQNLYLHGEGSFSKVYRHRFIPDLVFKLTWHTCAIHELTLSKALEIGAGEEYDKDVNRVLLQYGLGRYPLLYDVVNDAMIQHELQKGKKYLLIAEYFNWSLWEYIHKAYYKDEEAWLVSKGVSEGLAYVHKCGIAHLDLTPSNILLRTAGRFIISVKLTDFGGSVWFNKEIFPKTHSTRAKDGSLQMCFPSISSDFRAVEMYNLPLRLTRTTAMAMDVWAFCIILVILLGNSRQTTLPRPRWSWPKEFYRPYQPEQDVQDIIMQILGNAKKVITYYILSKKWPEAGDPALLRNGGWPGEIFNTHFFIDPENRPKDARRLPEVFNMEFVKHKQQQLNTNVHACLIETPDTLMQKMIKSYAGANKKYENFHDFVNHFLFPDRLSCEDLKYVWDMELYTRKQTQCYEWWQGRLGRVTGSDMDTYLRGVGSRKSRINKKFGSKNELKIISNKTMTVWKPMQYGTEMEDVTKNVLWHVLRLPFRNAGLFTHPDQKFTMFGASPDGVEHNGKYFLEIKCPFTCVRKSSDQLPFYKLASITDTMNEILSVQAIDLFEPEKKVIRALSPFLAVPTNCLAATDTVYDKIAKTDRLLYESVFGRQFIKLNCQKSKCQIYVLSYHDFDGEVVYCSLQNVIDGEQNKNENTEQKVTTLNSNIAWDTESRPQLTSFPSFMLGECEDVETTKFIPNPKHRYTLQMLGECAMVAAAFQKIPEDVFGIYVTCIAEKPPEKWQGAGVRVLSDETGDEICCIGQFTCLPKYIIAMTVHYSENDIVAPVLTKIREEYYRDIAMALHSANINGKEYTLSTPGKFAFQRTNPELDPYKY